MGGKTERMMGLNGPTRWLAGIAATMVALAVLGGQLALVEHYSRLADNAGMTVAGAAGAGKKTAAAATLAGCRVVKPGPSERPVS
ncbi:hypothetical protein GALL_212400 [mine drainage metagenome]|uniref:Uncharacterized protein n=1 Tax=mine drainage metagenome TaxID=410659 RepID=A0A1J5RMK1_9ZZZZ